MVTEAWEQGWACNPPLKSQSFFLFTSDMILSFSHFKRRRNNPQFTVSIRMKPNHLGSEGQRQQVIYWTGSPDWMETRPVTQPEPALDGGSVHGRAVTWAY